MRPGCVGCLCVSGMAQVELKGERVSAPASRSRKKISRLIFAFRPRNQFAEGEEQAREELLRIVRATHSPQMRRLVQRRAQVGNDGRAGESLAGVPHARADHVVAHQIVRECLEDFAVAQLALREFVERRGQ